jgi:F420-non-reducing hydrogenase small subunit
MAKPKLALYWASSCGGCEIAVLDIQEKILDVANAFDIVFWPVAMDFKYDDVRKMEDKSIDLCLFNGAIRNSENAELAHLLRAKSKALVAFGSCAHEGCIPALANLTTKDAILKWVYKDSPSTVSLNGGIYPQTHTKMPEGEIEIPEMWETVKSLDQVIDVDYYIPGCPPQPFQIWNVIEYIVSGKPLPPKGSVLGADDKTCCDECPRERKEKKIKKFFRPYEILTDPNELFVWVRQHGAVAERSAQKRICLAVVATVRRRTL